MNQLTSKIQYKNFEAGEFVDSEKRTYEETIALIESFPWDKEREKIAIGLTNPSITIEGTNSDYLKLAVFYNRKFVLHYLNSDKILFTKSFVKIEESYKYINSYISGSFDTADFKKENTWMQNNLQHFASQGFNYQLTPRSVRKYVMKTSGFDFALSIFIILLPLIFGTDRLNVSGMQAIMLILALLLTMFLLGGGLNLILILNYYYYGKDLIVIMSKGNDIFYFGDKNFPDKYDKKEIVQFTIVKPRGRSPLAEFAYVRIEFQNRPDIVIPNIFVDESSLAEKLFEYPKIEEGGFPVIRYKRTKQ
jgi:hypothetical protein